MLKVKNKNKILVMITSNISQKSSQEFGKYPEILNYTGSFQIHSHTLDKNKSGQTEAENLKRL